MRQLNSALTGVIDRNAEQIGKPIGIEPSEIACGNWQSDGVRAVARRLMGAPPAENDRAMEALLMRRFHISARVRTEGRYPNGRPAYWIVVGCDLRAIDGGEPDWEAALQASADSFAPADPDDLIAALAEMSVLVAARDQSEFAGQLTLRAYARRLSEWPADIAAAALREWPDQSKWWPAWLELRELMEPMIAPRRAIFRALEAAVRKRIEG